MPSSIFSNHFVNNCLNLYKLHFAKNEVYNSFCKGIGRTPKKVKKLSDIPFLPIEFFKYHKIYIGPKEPELEFKSSGTSTGLLNRSTHYVDKRNRYQGALTACFNDFFKSNEPLSLYALLPGYFDNKDSSLIYMIEELNNLGLLNLKGYYIDNHAKLMDDLKLAKGSNERILLWGVTFGLLDLAENEKFDLSGHIVLETGGMKGRRKEMTRNEVHKILTSAFNVKTIYSEYGMTELLSQAYSSGNGIFNMSNSFGVMTRDVYDPLTYVEYGKSGVLNIIDLNNEHSCPFIATQDLGRVYDNGTFEVLGRTDIADVRGCNLMAL